MESFLVVRFDKVWFIKKRLPDLEKLFANLTITLLKDMCGPKNTLLIPFGYDSLDFVATRQIFENRIDKPIVTRIKLSYKRDIS